MTSLSLLPWVALAITLVSFGHYFWLMARVRITKWPLVQIVLFAVSLAFVVVALFNGYGPAAVSWVVVGFVAVFVIFLALSRLPKTTPAVIIGSAPPDFTLPDSEGETFTLSAATKPLLLKFYRGHW